MKRRSGFSHFLVKQGFLRRLSNGVRPSRGISDSYQGCEDNNESTCEYDFPRTPRRKSHDRPSCLIVAHVSPAVVVICSKARGAVSLRTATLSPSTGHHDTWLSSIIIAYSVLMECLWMLRPSTACLSSQTCSSSTCHCPCGRLRLDLARPLA